MAHHKKATEFKDIGNLLLRSGAAVRTVNLITLYRIFTFPLLIFLVLTERMDAFRWLLLLSFLTDAVDGMLARKFNATSVLGSKLDSVGDDLTILAATVGLFVTHWNFVKEEALIFLVLFGLFLLQVGLSFYRYGKISTFHTYMAKTAAVVTALFLLSIFFMEEVYYPLFYLAAAITGIELLEEIILAAILRDYRSDVKGLYWVLQATHSQSQKPKANSH